jgi:hypothetical protein
MRKSSRRALKKTTGSSFEREKKLLVVRSCVSTTLFSAYRRLIKRRCPRKTSRISLITVMHFFPLIGGGTVSLYNCAEPPKQWCLEQSDASRIIHLLFRRRGGRYGDSRVNVLAPAQMRCRESASRSSSPLSVAMVADLLLLSPL